MLRHLVLFTLDESADLDGLLAALCELPASIPEIRAYEVHRDAGLVDGNAQVAVLGSFDDAAAWRAYQDHPDHQRVLTELIRPHLVSRTAIQFAG